MSTVTIVHLGIWITFISTLLLTHQDRIKFDDTALFALFGVYLVSLILAVGSGISLMAKFVIFLMG